MLQYSYTYFLIKIFIFTNRFFEIYVNTPLAVCEQRDVKGLYKKAREGSIQGFTGVTQAYESPENPDLIVTTEDLSIFESTLKVIDLLEKANVIPKIVKNELVGWVNFISKNTS